MTNWKDKQNQDGGWAYGRGCSWTEPTALVLLAQTAAGKDRESFDRGLSFIRSISRPDGGYRPQSGVEDGTWVAALVALLPEEALGARRLRQTIGWLQGQTGRESGWRYRLQQRLAGDKDEYPEGWPWFPGAAAWVTPTSLGILAFSRALRHADDSRLRERIAAGKDFLWGRQCADGGWNHGSNRALGRDGDSYPETTGIALLALSNIGAPATKMARAKEAARKHLASCKTAEGISWLRMGLAAHGEVVQASVEPVCRTNVDLALTALAGAERNPLL